MSRLGLAYLDAEMIARRHGEQIARALDRTMDRCGFDYRPDWVRRILQEEIMQIPRDGKRGRDV